VCMHKTCTHTHTHRDAKSTHTWLGCTRMLPTVHTSASSVGSTVPRSSVTPRQVPSTALTASAAAAIGSRRSAIGTVPARVMGGGGQRIIWHNNQHIARRGMTQHRAAQHMAQYSTWHSKHRMPTPTSCSVPTSVVLYPFNRYCQPSLACDA
jgi:hypothetical protein